MSKTKNVLMCFAHPDDAEIWTGGTILRCKELGHRVFSVCFETSDATRTEECIKSSEFLRLDRLVFLGKKKNWWRMEDEDFKKMAALMIELAPDVVVTHPTNDLHPEHRLVSDLSIKTTIVACDRLQKDIEVLASSSYNGLTTDGLFQPSIFVDVSKEWKKKTEAISFYQTQIPKESIGLCDAQCHYYGSIIRVKRAEGFKPIPLLGRLPRRSLFEEL